MASSSQPLSLPLSSHGPSHAPSLERGKACLTCRTRKVKCCGTRPRCGACVKSAIAHGDDPSTVTCDFDDPDEKSGKRKRTAASGGRIAGLEKKIAELERFIESHSLAGPLPPLPKFEDGSPNPMVFPARALNGEDMVYSNSRNNFDVLLQATTNHNAGPTLVNSSEGYTSLYHHHPTHASSSNHYAPDANFFDNTAPSSSSTIKFGSHQMTPPLSPPDSLLNLFYPGWPRDLPSPTLVTRLVDAYFSKSHAASGMINRAKLYANLTLPPSHVNFPETALLHMILATSARMVSRDFFEQEQKYWGKEDPNESIVDYHASRAKVAIDMAILKGQNLFQVAQAVVLMCFYSYNAARYVEVWMYCGLATRLATPLGLNHLRQISKNPTPQEMALPAKPSLLPPTSDPDELYERSVTFWLGVVCDRFASASTGWVNGIDEIDITSLLPSPTPINPYDNPAASPLSSHHPAFLMVHPPHLVQSLQLYIKAVVLLGRVVSFMQRATSPIGMSLNPNPGIEQPDIRTTPAFRKLDADTVTFRLSVPRAYQALHQNLHQNGSDDTRTSLIFAIPHASTILLHEPFCTMADSDASLARCLISARAILEGIYALWSSSFSISLLAGFIVVAWTIAARALVRELAIKQAKGIKAGQEQIRQEVNNILTAMRAHQSALGDSTAASLQALLEHPEMCLPSENLKHLGLGFGPGGVTAFTPQDLPGVSEGGRGYDSSTGLILYGGDEMMEQATNGLAWLPSA